MNVTKQAAKAFPIGSRVRLRTIDGCPVGTVVGHARGKVIVHFPDWRLQGRHTSGNLVMVEGYGAVNERKA